MVDYHFSEFFKYMGRKRNTLPSYTLHKPTGQARACWGGATVYLGKHGTPESLAKYQQMLSLFFATGEIKHTPDKMVTTLELTRNFLAWFRTQWEPGSTEPGNMELALRTVVKMFGGIPAQDFRAPQMQAVRESWIAVGNRGKGLSRGVITKYQRYVTRCFRWGVSTEQIPAFTWDALRTMDKLKKRRSAAREPEKVKPVAWESVEAVKPYVSRQVWGMIQIQWHTGMRPGEACAICWADINTTQDVWVYSPTRHKTVNRDIDRHIGLGKNAQAVLAEWRDVPPETPIFSPKAAEEERKTVRRANRKTPVQPSQIDRSTAKPQKTPGDAYTSASYGKRVALACKKAKIPGWSPNQIRHSFATRVRSEMGLHAAQVALGHQRADVTQIYAEKDLKLIAEVAKQLG